MIDLGLKYMAEREGIEYILRPNGFITFKKVSNDSMYLQDVYVLPEYRKTGLASELANEVCEIAKKRDCTKIIGSVCVDAVGSTDSLKVLLAYGFSIKSLNGNMIYFIKELQ
jgi:GNAT superfamily N-acetyltransferase